MDASGDAAQGLGLRSVLCTDDRDFLIKNNGDEVKLEDQMSDKIVGVYFSGHWCPPCRKFTPKLRGVYKEINDSHDNKFEIVFVSADDTERSFWSYFREMPWLAVPFSDSAAGDRLNDRFEVEGIPRLVILDGRTGDVILDDAVEAIEMVGAEAYPFSREKLPQIESVQCRMACGMPGEGEEVEDDDVIDFDDLENANKESFDQINKRLDELSGQLKDYMAKSDEQITQVRAEVKNCIEQNNLLIEEMRNFIRNLPPPSR